MPRAGWLAVGGLATAGLASTAGDRSSPLAALGFLVLTAAGLAAAIRIRRPAMAALAVGAGAIALRILLGAPFGHPAVASEPPPTTKVVWVAEILRLGSTQGGLQRALIQVTPGVTGPTVVRAGLPDGQPVPAARESAVAASWIVYAFLPRYPPVAPGDRISFNASLELPPSGPGFRDFLVAQGAAASVRVADLQVLPPGGNPLAALEALRRTGAELLAKTLPQPEAGLAAGIVIGLRDLVDRDLAADFTTAGLSHIVAISGWNIAMVGAVMVSLLRWLPRRPRSLIVLTAIVLYTLLAGAGASVVRAAVMGGVVMAARESGRRGRAAAALGLAVWMLVLADPPIVSDIGFQLSIAATGGLLAWGPRLQELIAGRAPRHTPGWLVESAAVSLAAEAATLPLVLLHFGRLSLVAPLANLLAAPFIAPAMLAALVGLLAGAAASLGVPQLLLIPAAVLGDAGLAALVGVARLSASMPLASLLLPPPLDVLTASLAAVIVGLFGTVAGRRLRPEPTRTSLVDGPMQDIHGPGFGGGVRVTAMLAGAVLVVVLAVVTSLPDGRFRMTVLDIGQGDAILLEGSHGARMLIDGGPDPDLLLSRLDERVPAWDRRLDLLVLSHPHEDHVAGLPLLLSRYRVGAVAEPGMYGNGPGDHAFRAALAHLGLGTVLLAAGDSVHLDGATLSVLWPRRGEVPLHPLNDGSAVNNVSVVFDLRLAHRRMLLTGDIQEEIDPELLAAGLGRRGDPRVDVLKVAHHGSRSATTNAALVALRPSLALISAGIGNPFGHPSPATIERLQAAGARVLRTDLDGDLTVTSDGSDLEVSTTGGRTPGVATPGRFMAHLTEGRRGSANASRGPAVARSELASNFTCGILVASARTVRSGFSATHDGVAQPAGGARRVLDVSAGRSARVGAPALEFAAELTGSSSAADQPVPERPDIPVDRRSACYDRSDDHSLARRSLLPATGSPALAAPGEARVRGCGDCRLPCQAGAGSRHRGRPPPGGKRGPPPRHRQGHAPRRPAAW